MPQKFIAAFLVGWKFIALGMTYVRPKGLYYYCFQSPADSQCVKLGVRWSIYLVSGYERQGYCLNFYFDIRTLHPISQRHCRIKYRKKNKKSHFLSFRNLKIRFHSFFSFFFLIQFYTLANLWIHITTCLLCFLYLMRTLSKSLLFNELYLSNEMFSFCSSNILLISTKQKTNSRNKVLTMMDTENFWRIKTEIWVLYIWEYKHFQV